MLRMIKGYISISFDIKIQVEFWCGVILTNVKRVQIFPYQTSNILLNNYAVESKNDQ